MRLLVVMLACLLALSGGAVGARQVGPVTGLELPRFVSLKRERAFVRAGPGSDNRVRWVYERQGLPLKIVEESEVWRRVVDADGEGGWVHQNLLSGARNVIVTAPAVDIKRNPSVESRPIARLERGVVAGLRDCSDGWCEVEVDALGRAGWLPESTVFGARLE